MRAARSVGPACGRWGMAVARSDHIATFHAARQGITEDILSASEDGALTTYGWLVDLAIGHPKVGSRVLLPLRGHDRTIVRVREER